MHNHALGKHQVLTFIRFVKDKINLTIDRNRNRNLHRNGNGESFSSPTLYDASSTPPSLQPLYKSLVWTYFGALWITIRRDKHNNTLLVD